uniref:hypothetical protein n=1 Tax=Marinagarivorans algicola TaxID=1513270 RepID=UPI003734FD0B
MKIIALATLSLISMTSFAFEWKDGVHVNDNNLLNLAKNSMEYAVSDYVIPESDGGSVLGYYLNTDASELFSVSDNLILYKSNYSLKVLENSWPLTRWPYESIEPEIPFRLTDHQLG